MESVDLTILSNILQIALTSGVAALSAWLVYRAKFKETEAGKEIARINNQDDMMTAYGNLQTQLASAAENMVAPLNRQIAEQQRLLNRTQEELRQLREYYKQKSSEQEMLKKRVDALESENASLRGELEKERAANARLKQRFEIIKKEIDTGSLSSGPHTIPTEDQS